MKVFYPGSFDPFTMGHADIVTRTLKMGFEVVIGVGNNSEKQHQTCTAIERKIAIQEYYNLYKNVTVVTYDGLSADAAKENGCTAIIRGVRNSIDYAYETNIANFNNALGIETILLPATPKYSNISSSMIREMIKYDINVKPYIIRPFFKFYAKEDNDESLN